MKLICVTCFWNFMVVLSIARLGWMDKKMADFRAKIILAPHHLGLLSEIC